MEKAGLKRVASTGRPCFLPGKQLNISRKTRHKNTYSTWTEQGEGKTSNPTRPRMEKHHSCQGVVRFLKQPTELTFPRRAPPPGNPNPGSRPGLSPGGGQPVPGQRLCPMKSHSCLSPVPSTKQGLNQLQQHPAGKASDRSAKGYAQPTQTVSIRNVSSQPKPV